MPLARLLLSAEGMVILRLLLVAVLAEPSAVRADALARQPEVGAEPRNEAARLLGVVLAAEPRIEAVQRAADARAAAGRDDVEGWRRRTRLAALVPRLVAEYRHDERSVHMVGLSSGSEVDYLRSSPGDTVSFRLGFDLDGLVFGRQELAVVAAGERAEARRRAAVERATRLYYERLRLRLSLMASPPASAHDRAALEIDLEAVTADLDALTGLYGEGAGEGAGEVAR